MEYKTNCDHEWSKKERVSRGKNLLGDEVVCLVVDLKCAKCGTTTLRVISADPKYSRKNDLHEL